jgi:hypothetical protein
MPVRNIGPKFMCREEFGNIPRNKRCHNLRGRYHAACIRAESNHLSAQKIAILAFSALTLAAPLVQAQLSTRTVEHMRVPSQALQKLYQDPPYSFAYPEGYNCSVQSVCWSPQKPFLAIQTNFICESPGEFPFSTLGNPIMFDARTYSSFYARVFDELPAISNLPIAGCLEAGNTETIECIFPTSMSSSTTTQDTTGSNIAAHETVTTVSYGNTGNSTVSNPERPSTETTTNVIGTTQSVIATESSDNDHNSNTTTTKGFAIETTTDTYEFDVTEENYDEYDEYDETTGDPTDEVDIPFPPIPVPPIAVPVPPIGAPVPPIAVPVPPIPLPIPGPGGSPGSPNQPSQPGSGSDGSNAPAPSGTGGKAAGAAGTAAAGAAGAAGAGGKGKKPWPKGRKPSHKKTNEALQRATNTCKIIKKLPMTCAIGNALQGISPLINNLESTLDTIKAVIPETMANVTASLDLLQEEIRNFTNWRMEFEKFKERSENLTENAAETLEELNRLGSQLPAMMERIYLATLNIQEKAQELIGTGLIGRMIGWVLPGLSALVSIGFNLYQNRQIKRLNKELATFRKERRTDLRNKQRPGTEDSQTTALLSQPEVTSV